jgi:hypothetical protein
MTKKSKSWTVIEHGGSEFASFEEAISNGMDILLNVLCSNNVIHGNDEKHSDNSSLILQKKEESSRVKDRFGNSAHSAG